MPKFGQASKRCCVESRFIQLNPLEYTLELQRSALGVPPASEARHVRLDFGKGYAVAPAIGSAWTKRQLAAGKSIVHDACDLAHGIVLAFVSDIESLAAHCLTRRLQRA